MKTFKYILAFLVALVFTVSCNKGIDPITFVAPGVDALAPVVTVKYPTDGVKIEVPQLLATINIEFEVTDDIELKSVTVLMDGAELVSYNEFKDYRRAIKAYSYDKVSTGAHVLTIRATDLGGKVTNKLVNFEKKPPYTALYANETFYMPFDGDYVEKLSFKAATVVGAPVFAGAGLKGTNAYKGATDSYLTFPSAGLVGNEFSAEFWCKINNVAPNRAGIISISPAGEDRTKGLRFLREGNAASQRFKLNIGTGATDIWNDGGTVNTPNNDWVHFAFTVSPTSCIIYINGSVAATVPAGTIDWTGCNTISIGSGAPNFAYWDHKSDLSSYDELRFFNKALTQAEIQNIIFTDSPYVAKYSGEVFYMPFEGNNKEQITNTAATKVGSPGFAAGKKGQAYAGATASYLTFPTTDMVKTNQFSAVFWTKVNATPDRAGILAISPFGAANFDASRTKGIRILREANGTSQQYKSNVGFGSNESWNDGGLINPALGTWAHVAVTVSGTESSVYINGVLTRPASTFTGGINWTGCTSLSIGSGAPNFSDWGHLSDLSLIDELRIFNKALTNAEVQTIYNAEK